MMESSTFLTLVPTKMVDVTPLKLQNISSVMSIEKSKRTGRSIQPLNLSALVVNKAPDVALKLKLDHKTPNLFLKMKDIHLEKVTKAKSRLENQAEREKK